MSCAAITASTARTSGSTAPSSSSTGTGSTVMPSPRSSASSLAQTGRFAPGPAAARCSRSFGESTVGIQTVRAPSRAASSTASGLMPAHGAVQHDRAEHVDPRARRRARPRRAPPSTCSATSARTPRAPAPRSGAPGSRRRCGAPPRRARCARARPSPPRTSSRAAADGSGGAHRPTSLWPERAQPRLARRGHARLDAQLLEQRHRRRHLVRAADGVSEAAVDQPASDSARPPSSARPRDPRGASPRSRAGGRPRATRRRPRPGPSRTRCARACAPTRRPARRHGRSRACRAAPAPRRSAPRRGRRRAPACGRRCRAPAPSSATSAKARRAPIASATARLTRGRGGVEVGVDARPAPSRRSGRGGGVHGDRRGVEAQHDLGLAHRVELVRWRGSTPSGASRTGSQPSTVAARGHEVGGDRRARLAQAEQRERRRRAHSAGPASTCTMRSTSRR